MSNELTAFGNILFVVTSLIGVFYFSYWLRTETLTDNTRTVVKAWILKDLAVLIRIGWWVIALVIANSGETYHSFFIEFKHWITIPTSAMYVAGQVFFIHHIVDLPKWKRYGLMCLTGLIAGVVTYVGF